MTRRPDTPVLIIAPSHRIATMIARGKGYRRGQWRYIMGMRDVYGWVEPVVLEYYLGGEWSPEQWDAREYLRTRRATFVGVSESELVP